MMLEQRVWDIVMRVRKGRSEGRDERRGWGGLCGMEDEGWGYSEGTLLGMVMIELK